MARSKVKSDHKSLRRLLTQTVTTLPNTRPIGCSVASSLPVCLISTKIIFQVLIMYWLINSLWGVEVSKISAHLVCQEAVNQDLDLWSLAALSQIMNNWFCRTSCLWQCWLTPLCQSCYATNCIKNKKLTLSQPISQHKRPHPVRQLLYSIADNLAAVAEEVWHYCRHGHR